MKITAITQKQKKILTIVAVAAAAFALFIILIFLPLRRQAAVLKTELSGIEREVEEIKVMGGRRMSAEESIALLKKNLDAVKMKFPEKEEVVLRDLASLTIRLGIETPSMKPQKKRCVTQIQNSPVSLKGCVAQEMSISLMLRSSYRTLGEFFRILRDDFPFFVKVDFVRMEKRPEDNTGLLNAEVLLNTYLVSGE